MKKEMNTIVVSWVMQGGLQGSISSFLTSQRFVLPSPASGCEVIL